MGGNGDVYDISAGAIGAVGKKAKVVKSQVVQVGDIDSRLDLQKVGEELRALMTAMMQEATEPEHAVAIGEVGRAQVAASEGDEKSTVDYLKKAGSWALSVASSIGVTLVAAVLKGEIGI